MTTTTIATIKMVLTFELGSSELELMDSDSTAPYVAKGDDKALGFIEGVIDVVVVAVEDTAIFLRALVITVVALPSESP